MLLVIWFSITAISNVEENEDGCDITARKRVFGVPLRCLPCKIPRNFVTLLE